MKKLLIAKLDELDRIAAKGMQCLIDCAGDEELAKEWENVAYMLERIFEARAELTYLLASKYGVYGV